MENSEKCFICRTECKVQGDFGRCPLYECEKCGRFGKSNSVTGGENELKLRQMMYYYLRHKHIHNGKDVFFTSNESVSDETHNCVQRQTLLNLYPKNFTEKIDMILMNLSLCGQQRKLGVIPNGGLPMERGEKGKILETCAIEFLLETDDEDALKSMVEHLYELGYLKNDSMSGNSLSAKGWLRIQELESQCKVIPQGFIAMWFDKKMDKAFDVIQKAIKENGYNPMKIDMKEHNNQIVPEIFYEIRRSQFVVADLTEHRNGVYYEAGYAQALDKQVIFTCRDDEFDKMHFDVAQQNIIRWENEEDLYERLKKRIEATVGKR